MTADAAFRTDRTLGTKLRPADDNRKTLLDFGKPYVIYDVSGVVNKLF